MARRHTITSTSSSSKSTSDRKYRTSLLEIRSKLRQCRPWLCRPDARTLASPLCIVVLLYLRYVCGNSFCWTRLIECKKTQTYPWRSSSALMARRWSCCRPSDVAAHQQSSSLYWQHPAVQDPVWHRRLTWSSQANCYTAPCFVMVTGRLLQWARSQIALSWCWCAKVMLGKKTYI